MLKHLLFIGFFGIYITSLKGQSEESSIKITKQNILKVFSESAQQKSKNKILITSNPWVTANDNNSFFKSDTITFYNSINYYYSLHSCKFINWEFYDSVAFVQTETEICTEPPTNTIARPNDWFTIHIINDGDKLMLETYNHEKVVASFRVVMINRATIVNKFQNVFSITLKRISRV